MHCDDLRARVEAGHPLSPEIRDHVGGCASCRDEYAGLLALLSSRPRPSAGLRDRVLASFPRRRRGSVAAAAAALLVGAAAGFAGARASAPPPEVIVRTQIVEKTVPAKVSDEEIAVLAIALLDHYREYVEIDFDGATCTRIRARKEINEMLPYCPIVREMDRISKERPQLVVMR